MCELLSVILLLLKDLIISEQKMEKPYNSFWPPRGFCLSLLFSFFRHTDHHPDMSTAQTSSRCCLVLFIAVLVSEMCVILHRLHDNKDWNLLHTLQKLRGTLTPLSATLGQNLPVSLPWDGQTGQAEISGQGRVMWWSLCWIWYAPRT